MELLCRVTDAIGGGPPVDLAVEVERSHTVADLALALHRALHSSGPVAVDGLSLSTAGGAPPLDGTLPLGEIGLVSGVELILGTPAPRAAPGGVTHCAPGGAAREDFASPVGWELVVASGPDAGARVPLVPGRHTLGRDRSCWLPLSDPRLGRVEVELAVPDAVADPGAGGPTGPVATIQAGPEAMGERPLIDGVVVEGVAAVAPGQLVGIGGTTLRIEPAPVRSVADGWGRPPGARPSPPPLGDVPFQRTPYFPDPVVERVLDPMGDLPERPEPVRFAWLAALAPLAMGVTMALLYSPRFLVITAFTPVLALASWIDQRRRASQRYGRGAARHQARLAARRVEIAEARAAERRQRFASAPDLAELAQRAERRSPNLWVRHRGAPDVLDLRLGLGPRPSAVQVRPETRGDEVLRQDLAAELAAGATLAQVPVTVSLVDLPVLALVGAPGDTTALAAALVLEAACLHSPEDVVLAAGTGDERGMGPWLTWLPHARAASSPLAGPHLASTGPALHRLLRELLVVAEDRAANTDRTIDRRWPRVLVVIDDALGPDPALVSRLAALAPAAGLSILWLTTGTERVPRQAVATVACRPAVSAEPSVVSFTDPERSDQPLTIERASPQLANRVAGHLAPLQDASSATASGALPRLAALNQVLGAAPITPAWVAERWTATAGHALPAPVGIGPAGPLVLDLVAHGPHGLIGGTSGAGKSELLMSLVAGLVAWNPPNRLNLLFVDYKGGAASDQFRHLPHIVGYVTNLDALLARRALVSLRAELNRRMTLLQGRAKDLAEMLERHPGEAPPSLVIVVDEFATLVKEVPEFVAGVVDIAQRGRSLGIHLLLATQRPSGAVNENILANTNLRIALRMLDGAESVSVIGTNDAALIPTPLRGRAFARLGPGQLVPFQTAWTGAPLQAVAGPVPVTVRPFPGAPVSPAGVAPPGAPAPGRAEAVGTQLDELLAAVEAAAARLGQPRGRSPWLDELPEHIPLSGLAPAPAGEGGAGGWPVVIGMVDDPAAQAQYPAVVDLESGGGLLVLGTGGSGRTTVLRTLAAAAVQGPHRPPLDDPATELGSDGGPGSGPEPEPVTGAPVTLVALDFASRELLALGALPHCALAAGGDDLEAVTRAIALLDEVLAQRRAALAAAARSGSPAPGFSRVLLLIDDYGNLVQAFEGAGASSQLVGWLETLNRVIVDGRRVGIHTALSASRRAVVKSGVLAAVANRLLLRQADPAGYADAGLPPSVTAGLELPPGRGFLNGADLVQVATLAGRQDPGREGEGAALRCLARLVAPHDGCPLAELAVPALPIEAVLDGAAGATTPWSVVLGPADLDRQPVAVDLTHDNLTVLGDPRSGRSTALVTVGLQLVRAGVEVWAVGAPGSAVGGLVGAHRCILGRAPAVAAGLADLVAADDPTRPRFLLVDDVDLLEEPALDAVLGPLLARGQRWAASTSTLRGYSTSPLVQEMKKARTVLYLQPPGSREVQEITGVNPRLRPGLPLPPGRGVLVANRRARVVQVARAPGLPA